MKWFIFIGMSFGIFLAAASASELADSSDGDCYIEWAEPVLKLNTRWAVLENLSENEVLSIWIENDRAVPGLFELHGTLFSQHGVASFPAIRSVRMEANTQKEISITLNELQLPLKTMDFSGDLSWTAMAHYDDGSIGTLDIPLRLGFHRVRDRWMVYDELFKRDTLNQGVLSTKARRLTQQLNDESNSQDVDVLPAYSELVSETSLWIPDIEGEGDEDAADGMENEDLAHKNQVTKAGTIKFCARLMSTFTDAGIGEDYFTNNWATPRSARGSYAILRRGNTTIFSGYLGDDLGTGDPGSGCTPALSAPSGTSNYSLTLQSRGRVNSNFVDIRDESTSVLRSISTQVAASTGTQQVTLNPAGIDEFNVYVAGAYAVYRHGGGLSNQTYRYRIHSANRNQYVRREDTIYLTSRAHFRKFLIAHEAGHAIGDFGTGNNNHKLVGTGCANFNDPICPANDWHTITSKEEARCALGEGFAQFYSADVFNDHRESDCRFHYYARVGSDSSPVIDCENGNSIFDVRYMENNCQSPFHGYSNELDWMRALWDVHTDGTSPPGFTTMIRWMHSANSWGPLTAFNELDAEANQIGGALNRNWDSAKSANGIDWPGGSTSTNYRLSVSRTGTGSGTVNSAPAGINCGSDCSQDYTRGTSVTLTASPSSGATFAGWSGACSGTGACRVTMSGSRSVTATFNRNTSSSYRLLVSKTGTGSGTVNSSPAGITCGTDCSQDYTRGTLVTLTASPSSGATFAGWSGACSGTGACRVTMSVSRSVTANFSQNSSSVGTLLINEVYGGAIDYVEIYNPGPDSLSLSGWDLQTTGCGSRTVRTYTLPAMTVFAGRHVKINEGSGSSSTFVGYLNRGICWIQGREGSAALRHRGVGVDFVRWGTSTVAPPTGTNWLGVSTVNPTGRGVIGRKSTSDTDTWSDWCRQTASAPGPNRSCR